MTRTDYDGKITVLADKFNGKRLNSPNDIVCKSDGSIWFTDPPFGIGGNWEGDKATPELPHSVYRIARRQAGLVTADWLAPMGLRSRPTRRSFMSLKAVQPNRLIWSYDVAANGASNKTKVVDANGPRDRWHQGRYGWQLVVRLGLERRARRDVVRSGWRDGVQPAGKAIGHIRLPERCANLAFGGAKEIACTWRAAIRCMRCTLKRTAPHDYLLTGGN